MMTDEQARQLKKGDILTIEGVRDPSGAASQWRVISVNASQPGTYGSIRSDTHGSSLLTSALLPRVSMLMASAAPDWPPMTASLVPEPESRPNSELILSGEINKQAPAETPTVPQGDAAPGSDAEQAPAAPKRKSTKGSKKASKD